MKDQVRGLTKQVETMKPAARYLELETIAIKARRLSSWQPSVQTPLGELTFFFDDGILRLRQKSSEPPKTREIWLSSEEKAQLQIFFANYQEAKEKEKELKQLLETLAPLESWLAEVRELMARPTETVEKAD